MKHLTWLLFACVWMVMTPAFAPRAMGGGQPQVDPVVPSRMIVRVAPGHTIGEFIAALNAAAPGVSAAAIDQIPNRPLHLVSYSGNPVEIEPLVHSEDEKVVPPLVQTGLIQWGELLYEGRAPEARTGTIWVTSLDGAVQSGQQYFRNLIGVPAAHQRSTGHGVTVAVLDTGVDASHPLMTGSVVTSAGFNFINGTTQTGESLGGAVAGGSAPGDAVGHGTFVAGIIKLVAPDAKVLPVVVLDQDGVGDGWLFAKGMFYAIDKGVEVINLSLSSTYNSDAVGDAIEEAKNLGIVVVAAAGNLNHASPREYPAMRSNTFGVAATDHADIKAPFSNFDDRLVLSAPGNTVIKSGVVVPTQSIYGPIPGGGYATWAGTSMATPIVSGVAALVRSQHQLTWQANELAYDQLEALLLDSAVNIDSLNPGFAGQLGEGRVSAAGAVASGPVAPMAADLNGDGLVNGIDLGSLLANWSGVHTPADLNGDGIVNGLDLGVLLLNWKP